MIYNTGMFIYTLSFNFKWNEISKIILTALVIRIVVLIFGHYIFPLPDTSADAESLKLMHGK